MATVEQMDIYNGKLTDINIGRMGKAQGEKIKEKLDGKTYMDFRILVCPAGGEYEIIAETNYNGTEDEILGMFMHLLATSLLH